MRITPERRAELLAACNLTARGLADAIGLPEPNVRRGWLPVEVDAVLEARAAFAAENPWGLVPDARPRAKPSLEDCLAQCGWPLARFARMAGLAESNVRRGAVPPAVLALLQRYAAHARANPLPVVREDRAAAAAARQASDRRRRAA